MLIFSRGSHRFVKRARLVTAFHHQTDGQIERFCLIKNFLIALAVPSDLHIWIYANGPGKGAKEVSEPEYLYRV